MLASCELLNRAGSNCGGCCASGSRCGVSGPNRKGLERDPAGTVAEVPNSNDGRASSAAGMKGLQHV